MSASEIMLLIIGALLVSNVVFAQFLGVCPYLGVSAKLETALGMGLAVIFVITLSVAITWPLQHLVLDPLGLGYLQTLSFILVIAALVQFVEILLKKTAKSLYDALGIYLPLITTNCAVLGVAIVCIKKGHNYPVSLVFAFATAASFTLAIVIMSGIRERISTMDVPKVLEGVPIALVIAGILSMAFMGFAGMGG